MQEKYALKILYLPMVPVNMALDPMNKSMQRVLTVMDTHLGYVKRSIPVHMLDTPCHRIQMSLMFIKLPIMLMKIWLKHLEEELVR